MEKYRVLRESSRNQATGEIEHRFYIQEYVETVSFFRRKVTGKWEYMSKVLITPVGDARIPIYHLSKKDACRHIKNLMTPVPENEVTTCPV